MNDDLLEFSKKINVPLENVATMFDDFIKKGLIYTPAKTPDEFFSRKHPVRFAFIGPTADAGSSAVSLGPFAIRIEEYNDHWAKLPILVKNLSLNLL